METLWLSKDMGQGQGAVARLSGDIDGDGKAEIVQLWANGPKLGMIVYGWDGNAITTLFLTRDMKQGAAAVNWQIGDVNADGKAEIIQLWANGLKLGMIVYGWNGSVMTTLFETNDMKQGAAAVNWQIGDVNGDGKAEIIQLWANGPSANAATLGMIVYGWNGSAMTDIWATNDMKQGAAAVNWQIGDVDGDGNAEIIQLWANGGKPGIMVKLGMIVYDWNGSAMTDIWATNDMKQGAAAVNWQIGDVNGDGKADIIQLWANGAPGSAMLGMIVYSWKGGGMESIFGTDNMKQGAAAVNWQIGDFIGDKKKEIAQLWSNGGKLGMILYGWENDKMDVRFLNSNMGQGAVAVGWLTNDIMGHHRDQIVQQWSYLGKLGLIVYGHNW